MARIELITLLISAYQSRLINNAKKSWLFSDAEMMGLGRVRLLPAHVRRALCCRARIGK